MTNEKYSRLVDKKSPPTKKLRNCIFAFSVGGAICTLGQLLMMLYSMAGLTGDQVRMAVPVTLIFLACAATGFGVFDALAVHAGAGTLVPITGFANAVLSPAIEFKTEGYIMGAGAKMFTIAGPVIVFGITAGVAYGIILCLFRMF